MPYTAKFSRDFYERLGDKVVNELVDWLNTVDLTYKTKLRELNDITYRRFEAAWKADLATLEARLERRFDALGQHVESQRADWQLAVANLRAELIKWMFGFWAANTVTIIGTAIALIKFG